jgi:poly(A) polymerase
VATFRTDGGYQDGRRPESIHFCNAQEDALRRDFTVNGMFYDLVNDQILDYVGGRADLQNRIIRAIGDPEQRFAEDHLRVLRAVRFAQTLGFAIDPATREAIRHHAPDLAKISIERIENEFSRTLTESLHPGDTLRELAHLGLLEFILPEVLPMIGQEQPPQFHPEGDVFEHTVLMLNQMKQPTRQLAYAVLLHDIGKPQTAFHDGQRIRFHGHEGASAEMAEKILRRLKLPSKEIRQIVIAVAGHMRFKDVQKMNRATLRKLLGAETFELELELHRLDCEGSHRQLDNHQFLLQLREQIRSEPILPERWITGRTLRELGVAPGPELGRLLQEAYDAQLEGRFADRDALLDWLKGRR